MTFGEDGSRTSRPDDISRRLEQDESARLLAEIVEEAKRLKGDPETLAVAEEFLPLENEALGLAEEASS